MIDRPARVQLRRARGARLPANTVVVSRPSKWGNPFNWRQVQAEWGGSDAEAKAAAASIYRDWLTMEEPERFGEGLRPARVVILADLASLRGQNLACWCKKDESCHADVLLELANAEPVRGVA